MTNRAAIAGMIRAWPASPVAEPLFTASAENHPHAHRALEGAPPDRLPVDDHADWQALFGILTPAGVVHFLPGLLNHVLSTFAEGDTVLVGMLGALSVEPDASAGELRRRAARVDAVRARLLPQQRATMASFATWLAEAMEQEQVGYGWLARAFRDTWAQAD